MIDQKENIKYSILFESTCGTKFSELKLSKINGIQLLKLMFTSRKSKGCSLCKLDIPLFVIYRTSIINCQMTAAHNLSFSSGKKFEIF